MYDPGLFEDRFDALILSFSFIVTQQAEILQISKRTPYVKNPNPRRSFFLCLPSFLDKDTHKQIDKKIIFETGEIECREINTKNQLKFLIFLVRV